MLFFSNSLFSKLSRLIMIMVLTSLVSSLFVLFTIKKSYETSFNENFQDTVNLSVTLLDMELDYISDLTLTLSTDQNIQNNIKKLSRTGNVYETAQLRREIESDIYPSAFSKPYIAVMEADIPDYDRIAVGRNTGIEKQYGGRPSSTVYQPRDGKDFYHAEGRGILVNSREIRDISSLDFLPLGTFHVYLDVDTMIEHFKRRNPYLDHVTINIFYKGMILNQKSEGPMPRMESFSEGSKKYRIFNLEKETYFATFIPGRHEGMEYVAVRNLKDYRSINSRLTRILSLSQFLIVLLLFTSSRRYVRGITRPLVSLSRKISVFELQNFDITLDIPQPREVADEIRNLYQDVNLALQKIQTQVHEDYMKQMSIQEAQLNMLQSQMNPHFLYNTLDSIKWMANGSGQKDISRMILALSRLMRHNLGEQRSRIPLEEELRFLDEYLYIQKIRFQGKLDVSLTVDPDTLKCLVIPFLVQPLVENSIKYGVEEGPGSITVCVAVRREGGFVKIVEEDNGPGFPEEVIRDFPDIRTDRQEGRLGLPNLEKRLGIYYRGRAELVLGNLEGGGSRSIILFPAEFEL